MSVTVSKQEFIVSEDVDERQSKSATIYYTIVSSGIPTSIKAVKAAAYLVGLPKVGDPYDETDEYDGRMCSKVTVKGQGNKLNYIATVEYDTLDSQNGEINPDPNPLLRKDDISFDGTKETEETFQTVDDTPKPIVNSAGETFKKDPVRTTGSFKLSITGNRAINSISTTTVASYLRPNAVNSASFTVRGRTFDTATAKLVSVGFTLEIDQVYGAYEQWKWELEIAPDWKLHIDDRGFNELDDEEEFGVFLLPIVDGHPPAPVQKPWPLDGTGVAKDNVDDTPAILDFNIQPKKDFSIFTWTSEV